MLIMHSEAIHLGVFASVLSADPRAAIRAARSNGFEGIQFQASSSGIDLTELSATGRREFRNTLSGQDQQLVGLRADLGPKGLAPGSDIDRVVDRLDQIMQAAVGLGSSLVCLELGSLPAVIATEAPLPPVTLQQAGLILLPEQTVSKPKPALPPTPPPDPAFVSQVQSALSEFGRLADRYSVIVAFRSELASFASLEKVLNDAACPWFGVDLNPASVLIDVWDLDEVFSRLGPLIRHVRGSDAVLGANQRTKPAPIGQGNVQWEAVLANLDQVGYRGWLTIDSGDLTDRIGSARAGLKYLRPL
jgi:sugar phosphate isomerase/epimerase